MLSTRQILSAVPAEAPDTAERRAGRRAAAGGG